METEYEITLAAQNILFISDEKTNLLSNVSQRRFQPQFGKRKYILFSVTEKMLRFCFNLPKTDFGRKIKHKSEVERDAETDSYKHHETLFAGSARLKSRVKALL